jgi:hypothetical protein
MPAVKMGWEGGYDHPELAENGRRSAEISGCRIIGLTRKFFYFFFVPHWVLVLGQNLTV